MDVIEGREALLRSKKCRPDQHHFGGVKCLSALDFIGSFCTEVLHHFRRLNSEPGEHRYQLPQGDGGGGQQQLLFAGIFLGEDVVLVVEVVELLGELEGVAGDQRQPTRAARAEAGKVPHFCSGLIDV